MTRERPATTAHALAPHYYLDAAVFAREKERIFYRTWQYAGHVSQLARAGDYFTFAVLDQPLFCLRDNAGNIRTFHNVCQHRAHELLQGSGNKKTLVCPYHAWCYDLDGRLKRAPNADKVPGFDPQAICLTEVRTENFCGFLFVNLDTDAAPMHEWYPEAENELRAFVPQIDSLQPVAWFEVHEACNWKVSVENYSECYHCRLNHPTFANGVIKPDTYNIMPQGHCLRHTTECANLDRMTYPIDVAANPHAGDYSSWFLWPGMSFQVYPGNVLNTYYWRPLDVGNVAVYRGWYTVDGEQSTVIDSLAQQDLETTVAEDIRLVESVQRGLASKGYRPGPLVVDPAWGVNSEHSLRALHDWLLTALEQPTR